ncbi:uncharacterized protein E0L32_009555 [Thyridium curvatum]|uniref:Glycoside hydrolase family 5 domain-containing protein n=1 Tax=Thyridium curvatum TaxID=1093900 RepID=A0A507AQL2_9PEZI|nr:uncharacterized protein E0L32_009555 [Thyridium curvatum]TPX08976.1 hypothetical protein E0L32_009555 [Thyridium curvatum]
MLFIYNVLALLGLLCSAISTAAAAAAAERPALPLHTSSRWILDANNARVKLRCVNWAGHLETNVPEGLHRQSVEWLAGWIADQGFNCVRLTYSIDHALDPDRPVAESFAAAGVPQLFEAAAARNPFLVEGGQSSNNNTTTTTTRDVFARVIAALWDRGIMTVLDNHVSRAGWCCNLTDGNGWWDAAPGYNAANSRFFRTDDWLRGLEAVARWAATRPGVAAMSLRNELRPFLLQDLGLPPRADWYEYVGRGARRVHAANPDVLVVVGGSQSATDLGHLRAARPLDTSAWRGKNVWEFHAYSFTVTFPRLFDSCDVVRQEYGLLDGFVLEQGRDWTGPLFLSEFGVGMAGGGPLSDEDAKYLSCLVGYMEGNDAEWAVWALQGSYYVRDGQVDYDEGWGLLNKEWTGWRNPEFKGMLGKMWEVQQGP